MVDVITIFDRERIMSKISQPQKIAKFLKDNPKQRFTSREIAEKIVDLLQRNIRRSDRIISIRTTRL